MSNSLSSLSSEHLKSIVEQYPWFNIARKELYFKLKEEGACDAEGYLDLNLYLPSKKDLTAPGEPLIDSAIPLSMYKDEDVEKSIHTYRQAVPPQQKKQVISSGADFFSKEDYENLKENEDEAFLCKISRNIGDISGQCDSKQVDIELDENCYTEALAKIYHKQGLFEQAEQIYSKLILLYPKKSAYFASLIEEIKKDKSQ